MIWWLGDRLVVDPAWAKGVNAFRSTLGLSPISRIFKDWIHSPDLTIGLFPEWFTKPQPCGPQASGPQTSRSTIRQSSRFNLTSSTFSTPAILLLSLSQEPQYRPNLLSLSNLLEGALHPGFVVFCGPDSPINCPIFLTVSDTSAALPSLNFSRDAPPSCTFAERAR